MKHTITVPLSEQGIDRLIKKVDEYERWLKRKTDQLASELAALGATSASIGFAQSLYDGPKDFQISVEQRGEGHYVVKANGESVLFIEFGSGVTMGGGHPEAAEHGMGPGTYPIPPGKGHWNDPNGWWIPKDKGGGHTYGNPPNAPMYSAVRNLEQELARIAREVFSD